MLHITRLLLGAACLAWPLPAASPAPDSCPRAEISCGGEEQCKSKVRRRELWVNVSGGDPNVTPRFRWCVSEGTLVSGQGTSAVVVDASGAKEEYVTVTVTVFGYDSACEMVDTYYVLLPEGAARSESAPPG